MTTPDGATPGRPAATTVLTWLAALAAVAAVVVVIAWLPGQATHDRPGDLAVLPPAPDPAVPGSDVITCERTLPERPVLPEEIDREELAEEIDPLGRATSADVVECPDLFDGRPVIYVGEVVGDVLHRDDGAWVLMNDDAYALSEGPITAHGRHLGTNAGLSVWLPGQLADLPDEPGRAGRRGDVLEVRGIVRRTDPEDGGGLTVRAVQARVLAEAVTVDDPVNRPLAVAAVVMAALAAAAVLAQRRAARRL